MKSSHRFVLLVFLAGFLHLTLGWEWTAVAGLAAGYWLPRRGWLVGAAVVGLDFLFLVLFSFVSNAYAVRAMTETIGGVLGNMPSLAVVALTVLIGAFIGSLSAAAGSQLKRIVDTRRMHAEVADPEEPSTVNSPTVNR